jgi:RNA polymerase sigma-70 factor (ECF subfamily)
MATVTTDNPTPDLLLLHAEFVRRLARTLVRDADAADDLTQDTLVAAWTSASAATKETASSPRGFLATIARRLAMNSARSLRRRAAREAAIATAPATTSPQEILDREALRRRVVDAVLDLDEPYRSTVIAHHLDELSASAIARRDGIPVETVRTRMKRAAAQLRARFERDMGKDWRAGVGGLAGFGRVSSISMGGGIVAVSLKSMLGAVAVLMCVGTALWRVDRGDSPSSVVVEARGPEDPADPSPAETHVTGAENRVESIQRGAVVGSTTAEPSPAVRGRCVDREGNPIPGATVAIVDAIDWPSGVEATFAENVTRTDGTFEVDARPVGPAAEWVVRARIRAPGFARQLVELTLDSFPSITADTATIECADFVLEPGAIVEGVVLDSNDRPLAGARVAIAQGPDWILSNCWWRGPLPERFLSAWGTTDGAGRFVFEGVPIDWARVYARGEQGLTFRSDPIAVQPGRNADVRVTVERLDATARILVIARDEKGEPVANARIRHVYSSGFERGSWFVDLAREVATDAEGRFECFSLPSEGHAFEWLDDDGGIRARAADVRGGGEPVILSPRAPRPVRVVARDENGVPLEPSDPEWFDEVLVMFHPYYEPDEISNVAVAIEDGGYRFELPESPFLLSVNKVGWARRELGPIDPAAVSERIEVGMTRVPGIRGIVRDARGDPVEDGWVRLWNAELQQSEHGFPVMTRSYASTRESIDDVDVPFFDAAAARVDGAFVLYPQDKGKYFLCAEAEGFAPAWLGPFELGMDSDIEGLVFEMNEGGAIEGTVARADGGSPRGLFVVASHGAEALFEQEIGDDGRYRLERLAPGAYEVAVREKSVRIDDESTAFGWRPLRPNATVVEGGSARVDLMWRKNLVEGSFLLGGRPRFQAQAEIIAIDAPIDFAAASLQALRDALRWRWSDRSLTVELGSNGGFILEAPPGDRLALLVRSDGGRYEIPISLGAGSTRRDIDLPIGAVDVVSTSPDPESDVDTAFLVWRGAGGEFALLEAKRSTEGTYRFEDVPAGSCEVHFGETKMPVVVRAGETASLTFE